MALETALGTDMPAVPGAKPPAPKPLDLKAPKTSTEAIQAQMGLIPKAAEAEAKLKGAELSMETGIQGAKAEAARETSDKANAEKRRIDEQLDKWPYPEFHPTQDNAQSMGGLFSLVATMGMMLGSSGKLSAQNAMGAMTGMLDGWKKGRQDLYTREKQNFDTEVARIKTIHDDLKSRFDEYMKLLPLDREAAALEKEQLVRLAGQGSVLSAYIEKGQFDQARQLLAGVEKQLEKVEDEKRRAAERAAERREREAFQLQLAGMKGTKGATQQQAVVENVNTAGKEILESMRAVMKLPASSRAGVLPFLGTKEGMVNFLKSSAGRSLSSDEAQALHTFYMGVKRNLATIENNGRSVGLAGLTTSLGDIEPQKGDSAMTVAAKLAETRKIVEASLSTFAGSGMMTEPQQKQALDIVSEMKSIIPYTVLDVATSVQGKAGGRTVGETSAAKALPATQPTETYSDSAKEARYQQWLKEHPQQ